MKLAFFSNFQPGYKSTLLVRELILSVAPELVQGNQALSHEDEVMGLSESVARPLGSSPRFTLRTPPCGVNGRLHSFPDKAGNDPHLEFRSGKLGSS